MPQTHLPASVPCLFELPFKVFSILLANFFSLCRRNEITTKEGGRSFEGSFHSFFSLSFLLLYIFEFFVVLKEINICLFFFFRSKNKMWHCSTKILKRYFWPCRVGGGGGDVVFRIGFIKSRNSKLIAALKLNNETG